MADHKEACLELLLELEDTLGAMSELCDRISLAVKMGELGAYNFVEARTHTDEACGFVSNAVMDAESKKE